MNSGPDDTQRDAGAVAPDPSGSPSGGSSRVLFVDDEPGAAELAATHVARLVDGIETVTRLSPDRAMEVVREGCVDCVVSDFDMPRSNGLELLESVREVHPDLPFVLFTGKGSEEIASEAISAGVTDYLQKGAGRDRYEMLANSVANALGRRRAERDLREVNAKVTAIHEFAAELACVTDVATVFDRTVDAAEEILEFDRCVTARRRGDRVVPAVLSESVTEDEVRTFDVGEGVVGTTVAEQETMVVDNLSVDPADPSRLEVRRRTTDGLRDFILHVIPVEQSDETVIYSVYADIDDQKRVERTLRRLHATTREMFGGEDREEIAAVAVRAAIDTLGFPNSGLRLYDPEANVLRPTAISEEATAAFGERPAFGPGDGRIWEAFESGQPVVADDLDAADTAVGYGDLRSLLVVPLGDHGVMPLGALEPGFFDETDVQLARVLAANVTVALVHAERTEQLRERDAALQREIDRLEKFAGLVSHDLRNPLNVAAGRTDLARSLTDDAAVVEELDRVEDAHDRMKQLIDDLLALARQGRTVDEIESVPLDAAAERAWETVDTGDATLDVSAAMSAVEADPERLRTLFENLFTNSVEHGSTGSRTESGDSVEHGSTSSRAEPDDSVEHGSTGSRTESGDSVEHGSNSDAAGLTVAVGSLPDGFYVADDGTGFDIDPEEATEYGQSSTADGTGFGLAIVREIAAAHGWELSIDADGGDGARFEFRAPN